MVEKLDELIRLLNNLPIEDLKDHIRSTFYEVIEKRKKDDEEFSRRLESDEISLFRKLLGNKCSNLNYRIKVYDSLVSLKFSINRLKELVNTD